MARSFSSWLSSLRFSEPSKTSIWQVPQTPELQLKGTPAFSQVSASKAPSGRSYSVFSRMNLAIVRLPAAETRCFFPDLVKNSRSFQDNIFEYVQSIYRRSSLERRRRS